MMRQVMWPSLRISPDLEDTKFMGRRGMSMFAMACRASSSMVVVVDEVGCSEVVYVWTE